MPKLKRRLRFLSLKKTSLFILLGYSFLFILLAKFFISHFFIVKTIIVEGKQGLKIDFNHYGSQSLFLLDSKRIAQEISTKDIEVKKAEVFKKFPDRLLIKIETRKPIGVIVGKNDQFYLIDEEGVVFKKNTSVLDIPLLRLGVYNLEEGRVLKSEFLRLALRITKEIEKKDVKIKEVTTDDLKKIIIIKIKHGPKVYISEGKEPKRIAASLQLILNRFKIEGKKIEKIDLRFTHPIISFNREATVSAETDLDER